MATGTKILERVKVREVAGVFRSREGLDAAVHALLSSGFDRADIDLLIGAEARERLGGAKIAAEELPEVPAAPRQPLIAREDIVLVWSLVLSILIFAGAGFAAWLVVKSGGELIWAGIAAAIGAIAAGWVGAQLARAFARRRIRQARGSADHSRARLAGPRSLGRRRGESDGNSTAARSASRSPARDHDRQALGAPAFAFLTGRPLARRRTSGPSRRR
jgi:hypothetical protein